MQEILMDKQRPRTFIIYDTLTAPAGNLLTVPAVSLVFFMLWMDRQFNIHFFDPAGGGG